MTELAIYNPDAEPSAAATEHPALVASAPWGLSEVAAALTADRLVWVAAWSLALFAHVAVLYALSREPADFMAGGGGQQIDAISVTIVSSNVLESREQERLQQSAAAAAGTVESTDGAPDSAPAVAAEQREEKKEQEKEQEKPVNEPVRAVEAITEVPTRPQPQRKQQSAVPAAGGAASRSDATSEAKANAPAAASAGAVREYARYVALALSRSKPKAVGGRGTVKIKFVIASDGNLALAEIAKSSGSKTLDDRALAAVRHARFPLPPRGMTIAQLTYEVPYHFR